MLFLKYSSVLFTSPALKTKKLTINCFTREAVFISGILYLSGVTRFIQ